MKKLKLFLGLFLILFAQKVYCVNPDSEQCYFSESAHEDELSFKTTEFILYQLGDLPSSQFLFNASGRTLNTFLTDKKIKDSFVELFDAKTNLILSSPFNTSSEFCRYSSSFHQIYLKNACFRL